MFPSQFEKKSALGISPIQARGLPRKGVASTAAGKKERVSPGMFQVLTCGLTLTMPKSGHCGPKLLEEGCGRQTPPGNLGSGYLQEEADARKSAGASRLSKLFLVSDALLRADNRLIKTKKTQNKPKRAMPGLRPPGGLIQSTGGPQPGKLQEMAPLSAVTAPASPSRTRDFPGYSTAAPRRPAPPRAAGTFPLLS